MLLLISEYSISADNLPVLTNIAREIKYLTDMKQYTILKKIKS